MSSRRIILFVVFVALQLAVIMGLFAQRFFTLSTGTQVVLRTVPVDPRDFIRGQYVALRYDISTVNMYLAEGETFSEGDVIYVTLEPGYEDVWAPIRISKSRPGDYSVAIRGKVTRVNAASERDVWIRGGQTLSVEYGIERYFVPPEEGRTLERSGRLKVFTRINHGGDAVIERVEVLNSSGIWDEPELGEPIPTPTTPTTTRTDATVKSQLLSLRAFGDQYHRRFASYAEPIPAVPCPVSGGSIFFRDDQMRRAIEDIKKSSRSSTQVRCAAGADGPAGVATSWAVSAALPSGSGSWCVDSRGTSRAGVAAAGGAQPAICR